MIKDSGDRTEFETGAKRDMHAGKGRMDLLPWYGIMEVSKHCEEGALKYGEHNVDKGIPLMKKTLKVIVKMACMCGAVALLLFEAYDTCIRPKINMIKSETWNKAWDSGYKYGYHNGRFCGLYDALRNEYITHEEYEKLIGED